MDNQNRKFVLHRNDNNIPPNRSIELIETNLKNSVGYPEVSVIIPTADGFRNGFFPSLLCQLSKQTYQNFETIIIKGDSRQGRAINTGAARARGSYLLTLDDDTQLQSDDAFERLINIMEKDPTVGVAGGINVVPTDAPRFIQKSMREIPRRMTPKVNRVTDSDLAEHPLLMIKKDVFIKVGGENELIPRGLDPYLRREFRNAGYRIVVVPKVYYSHLPPPTLVKLIKQFWRNGKQAAFLNRVYPQWVIETPSVHLEKFIENRIFCFRIVRFFGNFIIKTVKGHLIYLTANSAYAIGFFYGYLTNSNDNES